MNLSGPVIDFLLQNESTAEAKPHIILDQCQNLQTDHLFWVGQHFISCLDAVKLSRISSLIRMCLREQTAIGLPDLQELAVSVD